MLCNEGRTLLAAAPRLSSDSISKYWTASKCRLDRWCRTLRAIRDVSHENKHQPRISWKRIAPVCQEILATEILTRVWACIAVTIDKRTGRTEARPIIDSVMTAHVDVTNRVLELAAELADDAGRVGQKLNRLRKLTERWTDLLLGRLGKPFNFDAFAHDASRASDFADDFVIQHSLESETQIAALLAASICAAFAKCLCPTAANPDLNSRIATAILACVPAELFDSNGIYHSIWLARLSAMANDTETLINDLLAAEASTVPPLAHYRP
jgi:hypothetical protein